MTDPDLVSRLRHGAANIHSIGPVRAAALLEEAADVIVASKRSLASANAAHRTEIARADARFATITTLRSILGGASEAEIIENARAAVLASEIPDHRGPLTEQVREALEVYKGLLPLFAGAAARAQPTASLVFTSRKRAGWLEGENRAVSRPRPARDMDHAQLMRACADRIEALELELATVRAPGAV